MTITTVTLDPAPSANSGQRNVQVDAMTPAGQASTNAYVEISGTRVDMRPWRSLAYTIAVITNAVTWEVYGANAADYSDEQVVQAGASVAASATGTYTVSPLAPYAYYRVKIKSSAPDTSGTATVRGIAKA